MTPVEFSLALSVYVLSSFFIISHYKERKKKKIGLYRSSSLRQKTHGPGRRHVRRQDHDALRQHGVVLGDVAADGAVGTHAGDRILARLDGHD